MAWIRGSAIGGGSSSGTPFVVATGNQSVQLPIYGDAANLVIKTKFLRNDNDGGSTAIIGSNWSGSDYLLTTEGGNAKLTYYMGGRHIQPPIIQGKVQELELGYNYAKVDGTLYQGTGNARGHYTISLFSINSGGNKSRIIMGAVEIYVDGDLVMNLVPKKDNQTGEGYYHDDIGDQDYYSSSGTGLKYLEIMEE